MNCKDCKHWANLSMIRTNIKSSDYGQCNSPKIYGWDFMEDVKKIDKNKALPDKDEVLISQEYFSTPAKLKNENFITGKNFGCINFEKGTATLEEVIKITNERLEG